MYKSFENKINELKINANRNPGIFNKSIKVDWLVNVVGSSSLLIGLSLG